MPQENNSIFYISYVCFYLRKLMGFRCFVASISNLIYYFKHRIFYSFIFLLKHEWFHNYLKNNMRLIYTIVLNKMKDINKLNCLVSMIVFIFIFCKKLAKKFKGRILYKVTDSQKLNLCNIYRSFQ